MATFYASQVQQLRDGSVVSNWMTTGWTAVGRNSEGLNYGARITWPAVTIPTGYSIASVYVHCRFGNSTAVGNGGFNAATSFNFTVDGTVRATQDIAALSSSETTRTYDVPISGGWSTSGTWTMDITQVNTTNSRMKGLSNTTAYLWLTVNYSANSYTLTLNNGNASAIASVSGGGTKVYGSSCTATATLQTTAGYTFAFTNWTSSNTSLLANSTNRVYTFTMPAGNVTLTANGTRTVNYYPLTLTSGSYIASTSGGGSKAYNSSVTVNATVSTAAGYTTTFDGWYEGSTRKSTSTSYTFTMPANALTLQARATRSANQYNITWDANSGSANQTTSQTFAASIVLPVTTPVRQGYTFKGWFTAASGGVQITAQTIYETAGTTTYYAQWEPSGGLYYDAGDSFLPCLIYWCTDNAWQLCMAYYWNGQQWTMIGL